MAIAAIIAWDSDSMMLVACTLLAVATMAFIFWIEPDPADSAPHRSRLDQLLERRDAVYENLRDLKFEHRAGKFAETDYEQMKDALETEAALVLNEIDAVTGTPARPPRPVRPNAGEART
ncbi:MAG: hypothetical protein WBF35_08475 [Candidatus Acidiferrales bacterium]